MSTTTIRIQDALRARLTALIERTQSAEHSLIVESVTEKTDLVESRASFCGEADASYDEILETGKTVPWNDVRAFIERRARRENVAFAEARKTGK